MVLDHEQWMSQLPTLKFPGNVVFIQSYQDDWHYSNEISDYGVVGIDFEWYPDFAPGTDNPLALAQICTPETCYIWCLFKLHRNLPGLHRLLNNEDIKKVGCGLRSNDIRKLHISNLSVSEPTYSKSRGKTITKYPMPSHFEDIQDYTWQDTPLPFRSLDHLVGLFLDHRLPNNIKSTKANWRQVASNDIIREYAVLDAHACLCIHYQCQGSYPSSSEVGSDSDDDNGNECQSGHQSNLFASDSDSNSVEYAVAQPNYFAELNKYFQKRHMPHDIDYWRAGRDWFCKLSFQRPPSSDYVQFDGVGPTKKEAKSMAASQASVYLGI